MWEEPWILLASFSSFDWVSYLMEVAGLEGITQQSGVVLESPHLSIKLRHLGLNLIKEQEKKKKNQHAPTDDVYTEILCSEHNAIKKVSSRIIIYVRAPNCASTEQAEKLYFFSRICTRSVSRRTETAYYY